MIRLAQVNDIERIQELLKQVGNVHAKLRRDLFIENETKYNDGELTNIINDITKPIFVYINEQNNLCGYAFCNIFYIKGNNLISHKNLYIDDLCVDINYRNKHIGTQLYEYILNYAKEKGCYNVTLNVWDGNDLALSFYRKCGLTVQKTVLEKIL